MMCTCMGSAAARVCVCVSMSVCVLITVHVAQQRFKPSYDNMLLQISRQIR